MQHGCMERLDRKRGPEAWQFSIVRSIRRLNGKWCSSDTKRSRIGEWGSHGKHVRCPFMRIYPDCSNAIRLDEPFELLAPLISSRDHNCDVRRSCAESVRLLAWRACRQMYPNS